MLSFALILGAFLLGSIPSGVLLARAFGFSDPRGFGSGNIGAANLTRIGGKKLGALTFLCDFLKGSVPVLAALLFFPQDNFLPPATALLAVLGHCYSVFLSFQGGKGVATTAGVMIVLHPLATLVGLVVWVAIFLVERISSLAALVTLPAILAALVAFGADALTLGAASLCALVVIRRHDSNLLSLLSASERRFENEKS